MSEVVAAVANGGIAPLVDDRAVYRWRRDEQHGGWALVGPAGTICTVTRGVDPRRQWWAEMQFGEQRHMISCSSRMKAHCDIERHLLTKTPFRESCTIEWRAGGGA